MPKRPATTILLITDTEVLRADFSSGSKPALKDLWRRERAVEGGLATAAELALALGPRVGRRVLVLTTGAWTQTLSLPASSVEGMSDDELAQTLKFEVEALSGLAAFESDLAHCATDRSGDHREFWISQIEHAELHVLEEVVLGRGAKLVGVCHPAGLPVPLNGQADGKRLEFWRQTICCVQRGPTPRMFVMHGDPRSDRWQVALGNWESQNGQTLIAQWLVGPGVAVAGENLGDEQHVLRLDERSDIEPWLAGWASLAGTTNPPVPLIRPPRRPVSRRTKLVASAAVAAVVLAGCIAHAYWLQQVKKSVEDDIAVLESRSKQKSDLDKKFAEVEKNRQSMEKDLTAVRNQLHVMQSIASGQRGRFATLLDRLAKLRDENLVIERLGPGEEGVTLTGLSLDPAAATQLAKALHAELLEVGWHVEPPTQEGRNELVNGGPWRFTIVLRDVAVPLPSLDELDQGAAPGQDVAARDRELRNTSFGGDR